MAVKEKALADVLTLRTDIMSTQHELHSHLVENLRIDELSLKNLDYKIIVALADIYKNKNINLLKCILEKNYA